MSATLLVPFLPEMLLLVGACTVLLVDVFQQDRAHRLGYWLAQGTLLVVLATTVLLRPEASIVTLNGSFVWDPMAALLKGFVLLVVAMVFVYSREYLLARSALTGEYFVVGLFATLGMLVMISAHSLLTLYLGLELLSLSLYTLVAMYRHAPLASEAAMKYFVLGALASGMLLYGMSMLYGVTASLDLDRIAQAIAEGGADPRLLAFALTFIVVGIAFKLGVVPFHMWLPDVYQGAPTCVTLFIGSAPKIAAFALAFRLLVDGMGGLAGDWRVMLTALAVLSMALGNLVAIAQTSMKRMLAYSTIAHMGFLLLGFVAGTEAGYAASMFYAIVYALMGVASFGWLIWLGSAGDEADALTDLKGLATRAPWPAFLMLVTMFSMAGIPPFVGFWAKWLVLAEVVQSGQAWLAAVAVVFSIIGAYYYLRIIRLMYFDAAERLAPIDATADLRFMIGLNGLALVVVGVLPGGLMAACLGAIRL